MEKQPHQLLLLDVPEPPHRDVILLTRQLQQQEADYYEGLHQYINEEQAKAYQLPLLHPVAGLGLLNGQPSTVPGESIPLKRNMIKAEA